MQSDRQILPPQSQIRSQLHNVERLAARTLNVLQQLDTFLRSCPPSEESSNETTTYSPFPAHSRAPLSNCRSADTLLVSTQQTLTQQITVVESLLKKLGELEVNERVYPLVHWNHAAFVSTAVSSLNDVARVLSDIGPLFTSSQQQQTTNIFHDMREVCADIAEFSHKCNASLRENVDTDANNELMSFTETLIQKLLIGVQNVKKCTDKFVELTSKSDEEVLLKTGHISPLLTTQLSTHVNSLDLSSITTSVDNMMTILQQWGCSNMSSAGKSSLFMDGYNTNY